MEAPDPLLSTKTPGVTHDQQICQTRGWYLSGVLLTMTLTSSRLTMGPAAPVPSETWMAIAIQILEVSSRNLKAGLWRKAQGIPDLM